MLLSLGAILENSLRKARKMLLHTAGKVSWLFRLFNSVRLRRVLRYFHSRQLIVMEANQIDVERKKRGSAIQRLYSNAFVYCFYYVKVRKQNKMFGSWLIGLF